MTATLSTIQTWARFYADASTLVLNSGEGLEVANEAYQGLTTPGYVFFVGGREFSLGMRFPETIQQDTSISTTSGTAQYTWPTSTVFKFDEGVALELESASGSGDYFPVHWAEDEDQVRFLRNASDSFPSQARLINVGGTVMLELLPAPNQSSLTLRIRGPVEVTELTGGSDQTVFLNKNTDRALARIIAALYQSKRGKAQRGLQLMQEAAALLPRTSYQPAADENVVAGSF